MWKNWRRDIFTLQRPDVVHRVHAVALPIFNILREVDLDKDEVHERTTDGTDVWSHDWNPAPVIVDTTTPQHHKLTLKHTAYELTETIIMVTAKQKCLRYIPTVQYVDIILVYNKPTVRCTNASLSFVTKIALLTHGL